MKVLKFAALEVVLLLLAAIAFAQTPTPKPPDILENAWNVSVNGGYSNLSQSQTNNGFTTGLAIRVANHWNLRSDAYVLATPAVTIVLAGPEYRFSLAHFLATSQFSANASKIEGFANVEFGDGRSTAALTSGSVTTSKFAYSVGGGFDFKLSDTVVLRPLDLKYVRCPMITNGGQLLGNHLQFAAGLGLRF